MVLLKKNSGWFTFFQTKNGRFQGSKLAQRAFFFISPKTSNSISFPYPKAPYNWKASSFLATDGAAKVCLRGWKASSMVCKKH
jgi:hypothetical protein